MKIVSSNNKAIILKNNLVVGYLLAGYPSSESFFEVVRDCNQTELDIYEIGFPSTNPFADGEIIRSAHNMVDTVACQNIQYWKRLREVATKPVWLMAYYKDFIESKIYMEFAKSNVMDAIVIPDMEVIERISLAKELAPYHVDVLGFVNPSMPEAEMRFCFENFPLVYAQLHVGQTGCQTTEDVHQKMLQISLEYKNTTTFAGFGINTSERVRQLFSQGFQGAIIGTAMLKNLNISTQALIEYIKELNKVELLGRE
ncbi:MAG: tryptophan synthase subunit alpha [Angelakisella sp.]|nr:tryptophan synthase subunit alpha [Angelakisella sp.]